MFTYLLRPFVWLAKKLWRLLVALFFFFRTPILFILALLLSFCFVGIFISLILLYHGIYFTIYSDFIRFVDYVDQYGAYCGLAVVFAFLFFLRLLHRIVPDGRKLPTANSMKLGKGTEVRTGKGVPLFVWKTSDRSKSIVVSSPYQGIYVEGGAGAGKSASVVEPFIDQAAQQGFAGFLYDFKGHPPTLSRTLYGALSRCKSGVDFTHINLADPTISHRSNPLSPIYLPSKIYAHACASVILKNLNREWAMKLDFWAENAIAYLAAIIWFLRMHHPLYCSLPHAILLALEAPEKSIHLLSQDEEVRRMIGAISLAYQQQADKQLAGVFSSLQLPLNKLYTQELFWLLSGHPGDEGHVSLDVSDPAHPTFLSIGNDPRLSASFAPVIALLASVSMQLMNQQGKHKSVFILDEAPTLFIPGLEHLPATARSNNVATMFCVQDFSQLSNLYGARLAEVMRNNLGNQFFGMTGNLSTGEYVAKMAGEYMGVRWSYTNSSESSSDTASLGKEPYLTAHQVATQPPGHFIVKTAGSKPQFFAAQLKASSLAPKDLPVQIERPKLITLIDQNWKSIHQEVSEILQ